MPPVESLNIKYIFLTIVHRVNDRIISVNGISLENVDYATAVQVLRDSGNTVTLLVKRRVHNLVGMLPPSNIADVHSVHNSSHQHSNSLISSNGLVGTPTTVSAATAAGPIVIGSGLPAPSTKVVLTKSSKKDDFGIVLGCRLFVKVNWKNSTIDVRNSESLNYNFFQFSFAGNFVKSP